MLNLSLSQCADIGRDSDRYQMGKRTLKSSAAKVQLEPVCSPLKNQTEVLIFPEKKRRLDKGRFEKACREPVPQFQNCLTCCNPHSRKFCLLDTTSDIQASMDNILHQIPCLFLYLTSEKLLSLHTSNHFRRPAPYHESSNASTHIMPRTNRCGK